MLNRGKRYKREESVELAEAPYLNGVTSRGLCFWLVRDTVFICKKDIFAMFLAVKFECNQNSKDGGSLSQSVYDFFTCCTLLPFANKGLKQYTISTNRV